MINLILILIIEGYPGCDLAPFQLIPYSSSGPAAEFTADQQILNKTLTSNCSLVKALVKFPDDVEEMELQWLNESYVDLVILNKTLQFKVRTYTMVFLSLIF